MKINIRLHIFHVICRTYFGKFLVGQVLLEHAQPDNLSQQSVRFDVEPGRKQKGKDVRPVRVVFGCRHQML